MNHTKFVDFVTQFSSELSEYITLSSNSNTIDSLVNLLISACSSSRLIAVCGNGGSMTDAMHFCAELSVRYNVNRRAFRAVALGSDVAFTTACANDFGYSSVFERQVESLCSSEDVVIGISTSGRSPNIIAALHKAQQIGCTTVALTGPNTEQLQPVSDLILPFSSTNVGSIQSFHRLLYHWLAFSVEVHCSS